MSSSDIVDCIKENTFSLNSSLWHDKLNSSQWDSHMTTAAFGMCHTFTFENLKNTDERNIFVLDPSLNYRIYIYDPKFYHFVIRNLFPRIFLQYKTKKNIEAGSYDLYEISVTDHHHLNRPQKPCVEEKHYDFLECVKTSLAKMVGCRPPWDSWSPHTIPLCQTMEQLDQHEKLDMTFFYTRQKKIVKDFGCRIPCTYKVCEVLEYQLIC